MHLRGYLCVAICECYTVATENELYAVQASVDKHRLTYMLTYVYVLLQAQRNTK